MPRPRRNFRNYAAMEGANAVIIPALAWWFGRPTLPLEILAFALSVVACAGLLIVGTLFWRGVDAQVRNGTQDEMTRALQVADRSQRALLVATVLAVGAAVIAVALLGWRPGLIAASVLTFLAVLEYVNYYHRQLQHFDNLADFRKLLTGRGFRPAHMARQLAAYRRRED